MFEKLEHSIKNGTGAAMVTVVNSTGSTPASVGKMMIVFEDGKIEGTIGGGNLERQTIIKTIDLIRKNNSQLISYDLSDDLKMNCGGKVDVFVRVIKPEYRMIIIGGGHISYKLSKMAKMINFRTIIFDDRENILTRERFEEADELIAGNIKTKLAQFKFNENDFVVIVTHGHENDEDALFEVVDKKTAYIGVIGSRSKIKVMFDNLINRGIDEKKLSKVFAPIGLNLGGNSPEEIALSIISEIQIVKTGQKLCHIKEKQKINE